MNHLVCSLNAWPAPRRARLAATLLLLAIPSASTAQLAGSAAVERVVVGTIHDSLAARPLADATVQLVPADNVGAPGRLARTDATGHFRIDSVTAGRYLIGFLHPRLDSLGLDLPTRTIDVTPADRELVVHLAVPGPRTLAGVVCGARSDSSGVVLGRVLDAGIGAPLAGGAVDVRWGELVADRTGVHRVVESRRGVAGPGGRYAVCDVPVGNDVGLQAHAVTTSAASGVVEVRLAPDAPFLYRDLLVDALPAPSVVGTAAAAAGGGRETSLASPQARARGTAVLAGVVQRPDQTPLANARIVVRTLAADGSDATGPDAVAVSGTDGRYRLAGLPAGTRSVALFALGHAPVRTAVDLRPEQVTTADLVAGPRVDTLATLRVYAAPIKANSEFARRRRLGIGHFYDAAAITRRRPATVAHALIGVPGLEVSDMERGRPILRARHGCMPSLFVDGMRVPDATTASIDLWVSLREIGGIEVYPNGYDAPTQYAGCAVVLIWTKWMILQ